MTSKKALLLWAIASIPWVILVGRSILPHYTAILAPSQYIYIPMAQPARLMDANTEHRDLLTRTRLTGNYWIDSFGIEGEVNIEYMVEITPSDQFRTWIPHKTSYASLPLSSPIWLDFRQQLISQAMTRRHEEKERVLQQHAFQDALLLLGVPLMCLVVIFAYRANAGLLDRPAQGKLPDL